MRDHEKVNEAASLVGRTPFRYRSAPPFAFQSFSISFGTVLVEASLFLQGGPLVFREERAIDIACCIAARFAFHLQEGGERRNRERHRKLTVIAFNVTRARTDQSQLLEVTESRGRRRNQLLSAFWWNSRAREPLFAKTYGGMFLSSLDGDSRRFRENDDDWEKNNDSKREGDWILKDAPLQEWNGKNDEKWEESVRIREVGFLFPSFRRYLRIRIRLEMREKGRELESVQLSNNYGNLCIE